MRRGMPSRARLKLIDRVVFVWLYRLRPSVLNAVVIVQPETVVRWHREGLHFNLKLAIKAVIKRIP
jgi:hypothetical protein